MISIVVVVVGSDIGSAEYGRELVLGGRYFVVLSLSADAESPEPARQDLPYKRLRGS